MSNITKKLKCLEVFYEYDGFPSIFSANINGSMHLCILEDFMQEFTTYLTSEITSEELLVFKNNEISLYGVLTLRGECQFVTTEFDNIVETKNILVEDIPAKCLPEPGVGILRSRTKISDTMEP